MKGRRIGRFAALALLAGALIPSAGCAYLTNRVNDASDVLEVGVTVSDEAQFAAYGGITHGFMIGYSVLRCNLHGLANSQWGTHQVVDDSGGWGFLGEDVHEMASGGATIPTSGLPSYDTGILGLGFGRTAGLDRGLNSPAMFHFGWCGVMFNVKGAELVDFLLGCFTLDIMGDDTGERPVTAESD